MLQVAIRGNLRRPPPSHALHFRGRLAFLRTLGLVFVLVGCVPSHAAFLRVPLRLKGDAPGSAVMVSASIQDIRDRMPAFDPDQAAFFVSGRRPVPFRTEDANGDGQPDAVLIGFEVPLHGDPGLVIVCPGPKATGPAPEPTRRLVGLDFQKAHR